MEEIEIKNYQVTSVRSTTIPSPYYNYSSVIPAIGAQHTNISTGEVSIYDGVGWKVLASTANVDHQTATNTLIDLLKLDLEPYQVDSLHQLERSEHPSDKIMFEAAIKTLAEEQIVEKFKNRILEYEKK